MSGRGRGRPPGPRPPSQKDLETPKIGQFFQQQPFAPIFQQRMGGGASQGAGSPHDHVDLTWASGESCSEGLDDQDPNDWDDDECRTADDAILCSSDSEDAEELPSTSTTTVTSSTGAVLSVPAATMCSSDGGDSEEDGEDSEELDSADAGPSGECSTKRGAPVTGSGGGGKRRKG